MPNTLPNRRDVTRLIGAGVLASAGCAHGATSYDLIIRGGRVIDPARKVNGVADVAIADGKIAAVRANIAATAAAEFDASGKLVFPGLIDIHTHPTNQTETQLMLTDGVTGFIEAGRGGASNIDTTLEVARHAPQRAGVLINIGRDGIVNPGGDTLDLARADVAAARKAIAEHRDLIVGVKARLSRDIAGENDHEVLRRAEEVARAFDLPVMIHMGDTATPLGDLLKLMRRGDIVSHLFAPPPHAIIDDKGVVIPEVIAARRRGIKFDVGFGRLGHVRWDIAASALGQGFAPDSVSSDWTMAAYTIGAARLPNVMSALLTFGIALPEVVAMATSNPAKALPLFKRRGTLRPGAPADVAIFELREGAFAFEDNFGAKRSGTQKLFGAATIIGSKIVWRA